MALVRSHRAVIGGAVALAAIAVGFVLLTSSDSHTAPVSSAHNVVIFDADRYGLIMTKGPSLQGVTINGQVRWSRTLRSSEPLTYAVCRTRCPEAVYSVARSGTVPPEQPDEPQVDTATRPGQGRAIGQKWFVNRPLLPGRVPVSLSFASPGISGKFTGLRTPLGARDTSFFPVLSADRLTAVLASRSPGAASYIMRRANLSSSWREIARTRLPAGFGTVCLSPDGTSVGVVGTRRPGVQRIGPHGIGRLRPVPTLGEDEAHAGICAVSGEGFATAVVSSGAGGNQTRLAIHTGGAIRALTLGGQLPGGIWMSTSQQVALAQSGAIHLIAKDGTQRSVGGIDAATSISPSELITVRRNGKIAVMKY